MKKTDVFVDKISGRWVAVTVDDKNQQYRTPNKQGGHFFAKQSAAGLDEVLTYARQHGESFKTRKALEAAYGPEGYIFRRLQQND